MFDQSQDIFRRKINNILRNNQQGKRIPRKEEENSIRNLILALANRFPIII